MESKARAQATAIVGRLGRALDGASTPASAPRAQAAEELLPLVYDELRRLARRYLSRERPDHTLEPTALVHEAYVRLVDPAQDNWRGRTHFFAVGARVMRHLLVDHARGKGRAKRGGGWRRVTLAEEAPPWAARDLDREDLLALDAALEKLSRIDEREARIVELRFFAGLKIREVASLLGVSKRTVEDDWAHARVWLRRELAGGPA